MPDTLFEFASFVLDPAKRLLLRDGVPQTLTPKAFDVLLLLVEQRKRVLSKDEMLRTLWPGTFVEEANLSQHIFLLRKLLNGDSTTPELIATIPRRGYRFVGDVVERFEAPPELEVPTQLDAAPDPRLPRSRRPSRAMVGWSAVSLALAVTVFVGVRMRSGPVERATVSAVSRQITFMGDVVSFLDLSPDGQSVAFVAGTSQKGRLMVQDVTGGRPFRFTKANTSGTSGGPQTARGSLLRPPRGQLRCAQARRRSTSDCRQCFRV